MAGEALGYLEDGDWVDKTLAVLPSEWQDVIKREWAKTWRIDHQDRRREANLRVLGRAKTLQDAQRAGLRLDANEDELRARAVVFSRHYTPGTLNRPLEEAQAWALDQLAKHGMTDFYPGWKPGKPGEIDPQKDQKAALARLRCERFWRRVLRKIHAATVEACSIDLGLVNKARQCYVSNITARRRRVQLVVNQSAMEATEAVNEYGQKYTLAELAAKGTANKEVRRAELMTRISGFDVIASDMKHEATFITVTCPSRMHKWTTGKGGAVVPNGKFDGTTPKEAQAYLVKQWSKCRAALARAGVDLYGFRVAEPHHDGCPHWHLLLWHPVTVTEQISSAFRRYFLCNDSSQERGAEAHRVRFERMDRAKGSAVSYIAKYIAKNMDGYKVGTDLYGNEAMESCKRVDAWASTWRIRQFQQVGGPPVSVWRELRRVQAEELDGREMLPEDLNKALGAVNTGKVGGLWAHGWADYIRAQGGPCVSRKHHTIKLLKLETGDINSYGEVKAAEVVGVEAYGHNYFVPDHMAHMVAPPRIKRRAAARIESERCAWVIVSPGSSGIQLGGEAAQPWTRVNNCTRETIAHPETGAPMAYSVVQRSKIGHRNRKKVRPGGHLKGEKHESVASW